MLLLQVVVGGLLLGAIYALFSSGLTLIWGMMNFINFAHGEFVMLGMYVAFLVVVWLHGGPPVFGFASAFALFVLGVAIYVSLIRHVLRGPMLSQILSTFGLALLLRYTAFFIFSANFVSLPETSLSGTLNVGGILMPVAQLVAGVVAIVLTVGLHLLLTRTTVGSKLLAVSEDRNAAMLMGIRPDRMQALAWGLSAGAAGIAGALMATSYPWSPSVGETFGLTAFVVVALGGFGSVPGALYAGLIIGLIQAVSAFWFGPIYKDIVVYASVRRAALAAAARPDGQSVKQAKPVRWNAAILAACLLLYPLLFSEPFYLDIGVTFLLAAISASAWNIVGGYAGQVSVGHSMFFGFGAYAPLLFYTLFGWPPVAGIPIGIAAEHRAGDRHRCADLPPHRALFQHGDHRRRRTDPHLLRHVESGRRGDRPAGAGDGPRLVGPHIPQRSSVLLHLPRRCSASCCVSLTLWSGAASAIRYMPSRPTSGRRAASACRCSSPKSAR